MSRVIGQLIYHDVNVIRPPAYRDLRDVADAAHYNGQQWERCFRERVERNVAERMRRRVLPFIRRQAG